MKTEYAVIYLDVETNKAEEMLNAFASADWKVVCSCATNRLVLSRDIPADKFDGDFGIDYANESGIDPLKL